MRPEEAACFCVESRAEDPYFLKSCTQAPSK